MSLVYLKSIAIIAAGWPLTMNAQTRPLGVCEALNTARDHQSVVIHADLALTRHQTFLFEGSALDPCPGWPRRFFTAPPVIPLVIVPFHGVHVSDAQFHLTLDFFARLRRDWHQDPSVHHVATVSGVLIRRQWPFIFRLADGTYVDLWHDPYLVWAAVMVVTSTPTLDR